MNYRILNQVVAKPLKKGELATLAVSGIDNYVHPDEFTLLGHSPDNVLAKLQDKVTELLKHSNTLLTKAWLPMPVALS